MRENQYDEERFFDAYSRFPRSVEGLRAAGEWHELKKLLPDFAGRRVLDLGCGFGWHCLYAAEHGAAAVVGADLSERMLAVARQRCAHPAITYERRAIEDIDYPAGSFDVVVSSLAFHYVEDFSRVVKKIYDCLTPGGELIFSCEHPVFTAEGSQEWYTDGEGRPLHWPVDRYYDEGRRMSRFLGCDVVKYHRTVTGYVSPLLERGFTLSALVEPRPDPALLDTVPGMKDELRRPMMLLIKAKK